VEGCKYGSDILLKRIKCSFYHS